MQIALERKRPTDEVKIFRGEVKSVKMEEIMLEESMKMQLHIQDPSAVLAQQVQQQQNRQNRPRRVKKQAQPKAPEASIEDTINSLKNEIEYMPMKTPISILQELLSRRGELLAFDRWKIIDF